MLHSQGRYSGLAYFSLPGQLVSWQSNSLKRIFLSTFISSYLHNKAFGLMVQTFDGNSVCFCHSDTKMQWFCFAAFACVVAYLCRECFCLQWHKMSLAAWNTMTYWSWPFLHHVRWLKLCLSEACINFLEYFIFLSPTPMQKRFICAKLEVHLRQLHSLRQLFARSFQLFTSISEQNHGFHILPNKQYPYYWGKQNQQQ